MGKFTETDSITEQRLPGAGAWGQRELVLSGSQFLSGMMRNSLEVEGGDSYTLWMYLVIPYSMLRKRQIFC